jgi:GTPase SAR1 family protein
MAEHGLGPNGAMLYCVEYLEKNFDWLVERLDEVLGTEGGYVIFDTPGQVELWTNHDSLKRIVERLMRMEYRVSQKHFYSHLFGYKLKLSSLPYTSPMHIISPMDPSSFRLSSWLCEL